MPRTSPVAGEDGWVALFDGESLEGWRGYRMDTVPIGWQARDGVLQGSGKGGDLATTETFGDFELSLEWKIPAGGNSGIILRSSGETKEPWHSGPEMQVLDNEAHLPGLRADHAAGALYDLAAVPVGLDAPAESWNRVWIRVEGSRYTFYLNGVMTADLDLASEEGQALIAASKFAKYPEFGCAMAGLIVLQDYGDPVAFRNILIRRL